MLCSGKISDVQRQIIKKYISGKQVYDLGCGNLWLSYKLLDMGASSIFAVDKKIPEETLLRHPLIQFQKSYFKNITDTPEIVFVSWPDNNANFGDLISKSKIIIYLGKNYGGTCCGSQSFWFPLYKREILEINFDLDTLIIYGPTFCKRDLYGEEIGRFTRSLTFEESMKTYTFLEYLELI
jgi:hypothetical protein